MKCPGCKMVEMQVWKVKDNVITHVCKKCGKEIKEEIKDKK